MSNVELLVKTIEGLPADMVTEVIDFAGYLREKTIGNTNSPRPIGIKNGKAAFEIDGNGKISEEAFLGI